MFYRELERRELKNQSSRSSLQSKVIDFCESLGIEIIKDVKELRDSHFSVTQNSRTMRAALMRASTRIKGRKFERAKKRERERNAKEF